MTAEAEKLDRHLATEAVRVTEAAAIASWALVGRGDEKAADQAAVDAMRTALNALEIDGRIVIGEGERDEAPMLYIGEKVGMAQRGLQQGRTFDGVDIAVDPLEGTNLCATGAANAIAVLAASEHGGLLHAPDLYMEKLVVGPTSKHLVDLDAPVRENLRAIARALGRQVDELSVVVLDRPRHEELIKQIRATGARILGNLARLLSEHGGRGLISICTAGGMGVAAILEGKKAAEMQLAA